MHARTALQMLATGHDLYAVPTNHTARSWLGTARLTGHPDGLAGTLRNKYSWLDLTEVAITAHPDNYERHPHHTARLRARIEGGHTATVTVCLPDDDGDSAVTCTTGP